MSVTILVSECETIVTPALVIIVGSSIVTVTAAPTMVVIVCSSQQVEELSVRLGLPRSLPLLPTTGTGSSCWQEEPLLPVLCIPSPPATASSPSSIDCSSYSRTQDCSTQGSQAQSNDATVN